MQTQLSNRIYRGKPATYDRASVKFRLYCDYEHYKHVNPERMVEILRELEPDLKPDEQKKCTLLINKILEK